MQSKNPRIAPFLDDASRKIRFCDEKRKQRTRKAKILELHRCWSIMANAKVFVHAKLIFLEPLTVTDVNSGSTDAHGCLTSYH